MTPSSLTGDRSMTNSFRQMKSNFTRYFSFRDDSPVDLDEMTQEHQDRQSVYHHTFPKRWINPNSKPYRYWGFFLFLVNLVWIQLYLPFRLAFENKRDVAIEIAIVDMICDILNLIDIIMTFFVPLISNDGEYLFERKTCIKRYLTGWFLLDMTGIIPYTIFKFNKRDNEGDDLMNFLAFNFAYTPRVYIILLAFKLVRIRKAKDDLMRLFKTMGVGIAKSQLLCTLWSTTLILHLVASFLGAAASFNTSSQQNWFFSIQIQDEDYITKYIACLYWATTMVLTVGYGDIVPQSAYEIELACLVFILGVAMFSYTLSALAGQFSEFNKSLSKRMVRIKAVKEIKRRYMLDVNLSAKLDYYFSQTDTTISISQDYEIHTILKVLPANLKTKMSLLLYQDAISKITFLQQRDQMFYLKYLDKLIPTKFMRETIIIKKKRKAEELFFILKGSVLNKHSKRVFSKGSMIGETDIIYKRRRVETYIAIDNVYVLKYTDEIVEAIMEEFPDIREDLKSIADERERTRLSRIHDKEEKKNKISELYTRIGVSEMEKKPSKLISEYHRSGTYKGTTRYKMDDFENISVFEEPQEVDRKFVDNDESTDQGSGIIQEMTLGKENSQISTLKIKISPPKKEELKDEDNQMDTEDGDNQELMIQFESPFIDDKVMNRESLQNRNKSPSFRSNSFKDYKNASLDEDQDNEITQDEELKQVPDYGDRKISKAQSLQTFLNPSLRKKEPFQHSSSQFQYTQNEDHIEKHSNVFSSIEMKFSKNSQRFDKMQFLIKKTRIMLNKYNQKFQSYLDRLNKNDNISVNEYLINTTTQAIKGIQEYLKILSLIESSVEPPRLFSEYITSMKQQMSDSMGQIESLEEKVTILNNFVKPNHLKELEDLLKKQIQDYNASLDNDSFRNQDITENLHLRAQESERKEDQTEKVEPQIHEFSHLYQLQDSPIKNYLNESQKGLLQGISKYQQSNSNNQPQKKYDSIQNHEKQALQRIIRCRFVTNKTRIYNFKAQWDRK